MLHAVTSRFATAFTACALAACSAAPPPAPDADNADVAAPRDALADAPSPPDALVPRDVPTPLDAPGDAPAPRDAATDAPVDPLPLLRPCLGEERPLVISSQMPYVDVTVGATHGYFLLDYATTFSLIDLGAFPAPPAVSGCDASRLGQVCSVDGFAFFAPPGRVTLTTADYAGIAASVRQAGIVGTDFLSVKPFTLSWASGRVFGAPHDSFCDDATLRAAGLAPLSTDGFFVDRLARLRPLRELDPSAASVAVVPNVPTVPVRVAGAPALAQLDTGFDDRVVRFSLVVNEAYANAITAADASALVRDATRDVSLTTCVAGVVESVQAYRLASGRALEFVGTTGGAAVQRFADVTVFVKHTPAAARTCGGIGTWAVPAAQVAASFYVAMGLVAFDPVTSRVWMPQAP